MPALGRVDGQLRHGQEHEFFHAVRDWLEGGLRRGAYEPLFAVARALGRRAWQLPALQDMRRRSVDPGNVSAVMRKGITLWLADPKARSQRVPVVPGAGNILGQAWAQPGQHRDVRAAIVAAARQRLHDPACWLILD